MLMFDIDGLVLHVYERMTWAACFNNYHFVVSIKQKCASPKQLCIQTTSPPAFCLLALAGHPPDLSLPNFRLRAGASFFSGPFQKLRR